MNQKTIGFYNQALKEIDPKDIEGSYVEAVVCRVADLVRQDEREQLKNQTPHEQQLMDGQASLLRRRTE